jgi:preprotein translocase subunit SecG
MIPLCLLSVFLILVILVQRGRGGGLTGALGGMGGQSAFGTKAGDLFTRITIGVAFLWVLLSMLSLRVLNHRAQTAGLSTTRAPAVVAPLAPGKGVPALPGKEPASGEKAGGDKSSTETPPPAAKETPTEGGTPAPSAPPAATPPSEPAPAPAGGNAADAGAKPAESPQP